MSSVLSDMVGALVPEAPPCFESRDQWVSYLTQAVIDSKVSSVNESPLLPIKEEPGFAFRRDFNYCADCTFEYRNQMRQQGACHPDFIRKAAP